MGELSERVTRVTSWEDLNLYKGSLLHLYLLGQLSCFDPVDNLSKDIPLECAHISQSRWTSSKGVWEENSKTYGLVSPALLK